MKPFFSRFLALVPCATLLLAPSGRAQTTAPETPAISLSALVGEIAANNPELKFYDAEITAAKAGRRAAASLPDPELSLDLGHKRVRDTTGALAGTGTAWSVAVMQTFEWPGRLDLRKAIANQQVTLAEYLPNHMGGRDARRAGSRPFQKRAGGPGARARLRPLRRKREVSRRA